jgi:hypothetical protein
LPHPGSLYKGIELAVFSTKATVYHKVLIDPNHPLLKGWVGPLDMGPLLNSLGNMVRQRQGFMGPKNALGCDSSTAVHGFQSCLLRLGEPQRLAGNTIASWSLLLQH